MLATGGVGGSTSVASHSVSSTSGGGGIGGGGFGDGAGIGDGGFGGGKGATSGGGIGGAGGSGCTEGGVMCPTALCTDLATDPTNCGACGTVCSFPNAGAECVAGMCVIGPCDSGWADCDTIAANGCEVDVGHDPSNCGACGIVCSRPHATAVCTQGMCPIATCDSGWTDCNNLAADGCEANLQNDPNNCGTCGMQCMGTQACCQGSCGLSCAKGTASCPGDPPCGCWTTLGTNQNCNFCGDTCALANATSQCMPSSQAGPANVCALLSCNAGWADCDASAANGCEVDTTTDPANCGKCGNACASGQTCAGGTCQ